MAYALRAAGFLLPLLFGGRALGEGAPGHEASACTPEAVARADHERQARAIRHAQSLDGAAPRAEVAQARDTALAMNAQALQAEACHPGIARLTRYDRLAALRDARRMEELHALWSSMPQAERDGAPGYALVAVADAMLYLESPREAQGLYERAIASQRAAGEAVPMNWRTGLYYALLESEQVGAARAQAQSMLEDAERGGDRDAVLRARLHLALDRLYADELDEAQREIEALRREAPSSAAVQAAWVRLLSARAQPRAAYAAARRLQSSGPYTGADVLLSGLAFDLHRWREARERLDALLRDDATDKGVQRQADAMARHDAPALRIETVLTRTHGPDPREPSFLAQLYGSPVHENWRAYAYESYIPANALEGAGPRHRLGAGAEWRQGDWSASLDANHDNAGVRRNGMDLRLSRELSDRHAVAAEYEANTRDLSVRAFVNRIYADAYGARYVYSANESCKLLASVRAYRFSDGNRRLESGIEWRERLFSDARNRFDASLALGTTRNSEGDTRPYFNPAWDQSVQLGLAFDRLEWREYGRSFRQRVAGGAGLYRQSGFASMPYGEARYSHEWDVRDRWNLVYGAGYAMHPYDGHEERAPFAFVNFSWYPR